jgi:hypothetical protein
MAAADAADLAEDLGMARRRDSGEPERLVAEFARGAVNRP